MGKDISDPKLLELPDNVESLLYEIGNKLDFISVSFLNLDVDFPGTNVPPTEPNTQEPEEIQQVDAERDSLDHEDMAKEIIDEVAENIRIELEETEIRGVGLILKEISVDIGKITATI